METTKIETYNRLCVKLFKIITAEKPRSCIVGSHGIINSFIPLAYGASGHSKRIIDDTKLKDVFLNNKPTSEYEENEDNKPQDKKPIFFVNTSVLDLEEYEGCINPNILTARLNAITFANVSANVRRENLENLNNRVKQLSKGLVPEIIAEKTLDETASKLIIVSRTEYRGFWKDRFESCSTDIFNITPQIYQELKFMESYANFIEFSNLGLKLDSQILKLPFQSKYYLLIVLPNKIVNKEELMNIIEGIDWMKLPSSYTKKKDTIRLKMPKFSFESSYNGIASKLIEAGNESTMGAAALFDKDRDLSQLFTNKRFESKYISMYNTSSIALDEIGVSTRSTTSIFCTDCCREDVVRERIKIDKPFAFFTATSDNVIIDVGMFFGDD